LSNVGGVAFVHLHAIIAFLIYQTTKAPPCAFVESSGKKRGFTLTTKSKIDFGSPSMGCAFK